MKLAFLAMVVLGVCAAPVPDAAHGFRDPKALIGATSRFDAARFKGPWVVRGSFGDDASQIALVETTGARRFNFVLSRPVPGGERCGWPVRRGMGDTYCRAPMAPRASCGFCGSTKGFARPRSAIRQAIMAGYWTVTRQAVRTGSPQRKRYWISMAMISAS